MFWYTSEVLGGLGLSRVEMPLESLLTEYYYDGSNSDTDGDRSDLKTYRPIILYRSDRVGRSIHNVTFELGEL